MTSQWARLLRKLHLSPDQKSPQLVPSLARSALSPLFFRSVRFASARTSSCRPLDEVSCRLLSTVREQACEDSFFLRSAGPVAGSCALQPSKMFLRGTRGILTRLMTARRKGEDQRQRDIGQKAPFAGERAEVCSRPGLTEAPLFSLPLPLPLTWVPV